MQISVSVLDLDQTSNLKQNIKKLDETNVDKFHIDVIDGIYAGTDNISVMYDKFSKIKQISKKKCDVHLMVKDMKRNIELFSFLQPSSITLQLEAIDSKQLVKKYIMQVLSKNIEIGLAINPYTDIEEIYEFLPFLNKIILMSVVAGKGGQKFMPVVIDKIEKVKKYLKAKNLNVEIEVDGGINFQNIRALKAQNIDSCVVGSYITKASSLNYKERLKVLKGETMLVNTKDMLKKAAKEGYAVGAFNFTNLETLQAILEAAQEENSPVIVQTSKSAIEYMGIDNIIALVNSFSANVEIPFALHLDHGANFEIAKKCIDHGYTSVMIDMSSKPFNENVTETKKVVEYAHKRGVTVEAEIGTLSGIEDEVNISSDDAKFTNPDEAKRFVEATNVDSLAIAIGTSHGAYKFKGEPNLRFDILKEIIQKIKDVQIVLHGASTVPQELVDKCNLYGGNVKGAKGCPDELLAKASLNGVSKINVDTDLRLAMTGEIRKIFNEKPETFNPRDYLLAGKNEMKALIKHKMRNVFKSSGKAK